jgi:uncharacterized metal-binding protein YceD (DUF177 family)
MERYRIHILGLSLNVHHFTFEVGNEFFTKYDTGLVSEGTFSIDVALDKRETFLETAFSIKGSAKLVCDRSLDPFDFPLDFTSKIIFKYGDEDKEISEDVVMIHHGTETLELGQYIYEFIALAIPMKKLHPRFQNEEEETNEEGTIVYSSEEEVKKEDEEIDPRWEMLKKLNKN